MARKKPRHDGLAELIRSAFAESGMSRFELGKRSSVSYSVTHRFITGERSVRLETADKMLHSVEMSKEYAKHPPDES